jgi:hypothetical protein
MPEPPVSVEAVQDRLIWEEDTPEACKPWGTEGGVVSGIAMLTVRVIVVETAVLEEAS